MLRVNRISRQQALVSLRQAIALPVYTVGLLLDYLSAALGRLGAWIAGYDGPEK